jgi:hypothetical protein
MPASVITNPTQGGALGVVEWSSDNNHLLLQRSYQGGNEFIIFSRADPSTSINVNRLLNVNPTVVVMRNKKFDQLYVYDQKSQGISVGNLGNSTVSQPILDHVLAFKAYGANTISYVTDSGAPAGKVRARFWDGNRSYALAALNPGSIYLLDIAQFQGHTYYVAGSNTTSRTLIYRDPIDSIRDPEISRAQPLFALNNPGSSKVEFSDNTRFVAIQSGQNIATYDFEQKKGYQYTLSQKLAGPLEWMDGHRLIGVTDGSVLVIDYDGTNQQVLIAASTKQGGFFSRDYNQLFTLSPITNSDNVSLLRVDMRAGADLPRNP